jgi:cobaltochelatase CobS
MSEEKEKLEQIIATSESKEIRDEAIKQLEELSQSPDDVTSQLVGLSSLLSNVGTDESEVKKIVDSELKRRKISIQDLDTKLKAIIDGISTTINVTIQSGGKTLTRKMTINDATKRPLIQKVLSDAAARNNVYLYGGAGTGKTFSAETIADALGFDIITINCNQFTSALEIIGGQTIDGYQEGKVIRAFGNLDEEGNPTGRGCVLLLDELPKIDPNTAGLLNAALAKSGEFKKGRPAKLENARGIKVERKEFFVMATGNSLLNSVDAEYEANFKQDLSLQDRFAGSTYEVFVDREFEWKNILNEKWAFIYIYMSKLRDKIVEEKYTGKAFVSIRIMMSAQKTYNVFRQIKAGKGLKEVPSLSYTPASYFGTGLIQKSTVKTIIDTLDEFFILFTENQRERLKEDTDFDGFKKIVAQKNKLPLDQLKPAEELDEVKKIISK